ncbi:uncharacterized protein LOC124111497 isoform X2 [Haliotis rufescens]|uniref:uncharacterized protein LOC124111497 isoform X2 n=1 Tax=Haliotis rufescens TaxID=6454 RepID=UPI00201E8B94|nr:uncharacterized protein LOC124111497 isoform X2 [Haliotis rufescens]
MLLVLYYLVVVHVLPSDSQFDGCLRKQFNCIAAKFRGEYTPLGFHLTDSTEKVFYDEDRRMIAREEYAHTDGQPFLTFRLYDYPNETLYDVVTVDGKETCVKLALDEPFRKVCMPTSVFETVWIQNITDTPVSSAFFTPPPSCMDAVLQNTLEPYRRNWGYLAF